MRRSPATRSRTWCGRPTCTACRRWCACPATRRRRSPRRSTAARKACWCRASRPPRRPQAAVKASRYPPQGERGVGPGRAAGYGYRISEYLGSRQCANRGRGAGRDRRRAGQCRGDRRDGRRRRGLRRPRRPFRVDRCASARQAPRGSTQAIETIIAAALAHGKVAGIFCAKPEDVGQMGRQRRQLLHPGQRHDVSRRRALRPLCRGPRCAGIRRAPVTGLTLICRDKRKLFKLKTFALKSAALRISISCRSLFLREDGSSRQSVKLRPGCA